MNKNFTVGTCYSTSVVGLDVIIMAVNGGDSPFALTAPIVSEGHPLLERSRGYLLPSFTIAGKPAYALPDYEVGVDFSVFGESLGAPSFDGDSWRKFTRRIMSGEADINSHLTHEAVEPTENFMRALNELFEKVETLSHAGGDRILG